MLDIDLVPKTVRNFFGHEMKRMHPCTVIRCIPCEAHQRTQELFRIIRIKQRETNKGPRGTGIIKYGTAANGNGEISGQLRMLLKLEQKQRYRTRVQA
jgi:hypothetical protein